MTTFTMDFEELEIETDVGVGFFCGTFTFDRSSSVTGVEIAPYWKALKPVPPAGFARLAAILSARYADAMDEAVEAWEDDRAARIADWKRDQIKHEGALP